ncbi:MAG: PHP domain-containing protein [Candidatus Latescibacterota bacterium]|nr:PHP domain-containing protein [Candidatus Latescibacterota bacterium]
MDGLIDLHLHSTCSDGSSTPKEVVQRAAGLGLKIISLTDHDSVSGVSEAQEAGEALGIQVVPGAELSAQHDGLDVHILAYFVDHTSEGLIHSLAQYQDERRNRAERIVKKLNRLGVKVTFEQVLAKADGASIGRPHIADVLVEEGVCFSPNEAFFKYLGYGKSAYEEKYMMSPSEAFRVIHEAGGVAVLAHPVLYRSDTMLSGLVEEGLDGIEVWHIKHKAEDSRRYSAFAEEHGLLRSGGSDCHGDARGDAIIGKVPVPAFLYTELKTGRDELFSTE